MSRFGPFCVGVAERPPDPVCQHVAAPPRERERHRVEATEFLGRRLRQLANEREKLLRAHYADAIDVATLKREQARINAEVAEAESQLAIDGEQLTQAKQIIDLALDLAKDCAASYRKAGPDARKMWNRAFFRTIQVRASRIERFEYEEPFASLLGSHKGSIVDLAGRCVNRLSSFKSSGNKRGCIGTRMSSPTNPSGGSPRVQPGGPSSGHLGGRAWRIRSGRDSC